VEFQYGGRLGEFNDMSSQSHVSHIRVLPLGEFTVTIPEPHAGIFKIVFCHIYLFLFLMQFRLGRAAAFVSSPIHLFKSFKFRTFCEIWGQVVSRVLVLCALYTCQAVSVEDVCGQMTNVIKPTSCSSAPSHTRRVGVTLALYSSYCHYSLGLFY